jgi:urease accessory protein
MERVVAPAAYALCACGYGIGAEPALAAYIWAWLEAQVAAAIKCIPLGQVRGSDCSKTWARAFPRSPTGARATLDDDVTSFAPGLAWQAHVTKLSTLGFSALEVRSLAIAQPLRVGIGGPVGSGRRR